MDTITQRLIHAIEDPASVWSDKELTSLGCELFERQYQHNAPYRSFCQGRSITPASITHWQQIPAVPTDAFKFVPLTCATHPVQTFRTSGTTQSNSGQHAMGEDGVAAYTASLAPPFLHHVLAGLPRGKRHPFIVLAPSSTTMPHSSLSFMLSRLVELYGSPQSAFFVTPSASGDLLLDTKACAKALRVLSQSSTPIVLLGTAFALAALFEDTPINLTLPPGSRVMETGGFKGRTTSITKQTLYEQFTNRLGIPPSHCISEYSMTELSSQSYTTTLLQHHTSNPIPHEHNALVTPPWSRLMVVDPVTFTPLTNPGDRGLIRWFDLANVDSVLAVQTSDIGHLGAHGGVILEGRAPDQDLRGCSLTIEEIRQGSST